jgi:hypothetical protein
VKHPVAKIMDPHASKKKNLAIILARAFGILLLRGKGLKIKVSSRKITPFY